MQSDWRTIDSVPKDGRWVLLWLTPLPWQAGLERGCCDVGKWINHNGGGLTHMRMGIPTYWQPAPEPPERE